MTDPHRYDDEEVRAIFERATKVEVAALPSVRYEKTSSAGLTLAEIQAIGIEAGIDAGRIAEAATALTSFGRDTPVGRHLGVDLSATHTVDLPRILTDLEWDHLVVRLRDAFGAKGEVRTEGSLRTWTHTHVEVLLEPTPGGARLRMEWKDWGSRQWVDGGVGGAGSGAMGLGLFGAMTAFGNAALAGPSAFMAGVAAVGGLSWAVGRWLADRRRPKRRAHLVALGDTVLREVAETDRRIPPATS